MSLHPIARGSLPRISTLLSICTVLALASCQSAGMTDTMTTGSIAGQARLQDRPVAPIRNRATSPNNGGALLAMHRNNNGLAGLSHDPSLDAAAQRLSDYMSSVSRMTHDTGVPRTGSRLIAAENIAAGRLPLAGVFDMWMASPGHRRNMLSTRWSRYGLAYTADRHSPEKRYWALLMAP